MLLQRSVSMGHDRLALHRLEDAKRLGADVDAGILAYCGRLASVRKNTIGPNERTT